MKKKYIIPEVNIAESILEGFLLAGTVLPKDPNSQLPGQSEIDIPEEKKDVDMGSKKYNAWLSWDE